MKKPNQKNELISMQPFEIRFKKVYNISSQSKETMAFVFYKN